MENFILDLSFLENKEVKNDETETEIHNEEEMKIDETIPFPKNFTGEIYIITSKTSGKSYVGQARSHTIRNGVYLSHGYLRRWQQHIQEAYSSKPKSCFALNNAIFKYGPSDFEVKLIDYCDIVDKNDFQTLNEMEIEYITKFNTLVPDGYNINTGGFHTHLTIKQRKHHSEKLKEHYSDEKNIKRLSNIITTNKDNKKINKYIGDDNIDFCYVRYHTWNEREGMRILIHFKDNKKCEKVEFRRSVLSSVEDTYKRAKEFINSTLQGKTIYIECDDFKKYYLSNTN